MDMVVEEVVDKELTKVVEQVNKELVKEFNEGLMKVYLWKVKNVMLEGVMDVMVDEVVDKEVTKVVEEVNKELVKEVMEGLVLVCRYGDGRRGDHKVDSSGEKPSACELCAKTYQN